MAKRGLEVHQFGRAPQPFELVIGSSGTRENVNQKVSVIHQDPFGRGVTFHADGQFAHVFKTLVNLVANRLPLPRVAN